MSCDLVAKRKANGSYNIYEKYRKTTYKPKTIWDDVSVITEKGTVELGELGLSEFFDFPKPIGLLHKILQIGKNPEDIILDFFSGSATTAHAIQQLNAEDGGNRKYIMVQLPEVCEEGTEAAKAGYSNICEIGKERIRRASKKIKGEHPDWNGDMGFKVFKLDTSNLLPWNPNADELEQNLFAAVDNVLEGRTTDDLLHEILLKCNLPLTLPIETKQCGSNTIYLVGAGALAICLDKPIPATIAEEIVKLRDEYAPIVPMQVVFRDNGFNDVTKTNALQILKQAGFEEKSIQTI
jgi:adenine-specific DNA-methyltransferase